MRAAALPTCPAARCQRVKACVCAHEGVFCQRTHVSHAAYLAARPQPAACPYPEDLELQREWMVEQIEVRKFQRDAMIERWKAGAFDAIYGKWRPRGVVLTPPPKVFR